MTAQTIHEREMPNWRDHPCAWGVEEYANQRPQSNDEIGCLVSEVRVSYADGVTSRWSPDGALIVTRVLR